MGFRPDGGWSIYFDEDPVYQFNSAGQVRRVFIAGQRLEASNGQLLQLNRQTAGGRVELTRVALAVEQQGKVCADLQNALNACSSLVANREWEIVQVFPTSISASDIESRVLAALASTQNDLVIAVSPHAGGDQG